MGLNILEKRLREIKEEMMKKDPTGKGAPIWLGKNGLLNVANLICLDEFLKYLALNPALLAQFRALLGTGAVVIAELNAAIQLIISQLEVYNTLAQNTISQFKALEAATVGRLSSFPFKDPRFMSCAPIQLVQRIVTSAIPKPDLKSKIPGNAKKVAKKYEQFHAGLRGMEYQLIRNRKTIKALESKLAEYTATLAAWQAVLEAIGEQFPDTPFIS